MSMNANEIKALREMLNLSLKEFGEKIGASATTIMNYEKGSNIPASKLKLLENFKNSLGNNFEKPLHLEKNGVKVELIELVDHFTKNADAYYEHSEYLQLWIKNKVEDLLNERIATITSLVKKAN